jgi:BolA protein
MTKVNSIESLLHAALEAAFHPKTLVVEDDSARHAGHAGAQPGGETHFNVTVVSDAFAGRSRLERHRLVYAAVDEWMDNPVHALRIIAKTPEEAA